MINYLLQGKDLICTHNETINQHERLVDKLFFVIPLVYGEVEMPNLSLYIRYSTLDNVLHTEELEIVDNPYKEDYFRFTVNVDSRITKLPGVVKFKIIGINDDVEGEEVVFVSNTARLEVNKVAIKWALSDSEDYSSGGVDGIKLSEDGKTLFLTKKGKQVGDPIDIAKLVDSEILATASETGKVVELP